MNSCGELEREAGMCCDNCGCYEASLVYGGNRLCTDCYIQARDAKTYSRNRYCGNCRHYDPKASVFAPCGAGYTFNQRFAFLADRCWEARNV